MEAVWKPGEFGGLTMPKKTQMTEQIYNYLKTVIP